MECNPHYCKTDLTKATKSFKQVKPFILTGICEALCHQGEVLDWGGRPVALENVQVGFAPEHDLIAWVTSDRVGFSEPVSSSVISVNSDWHG